MKKEENAKKLFEQLGDKFKNASEKALAEKYFVLGRCYKKDVEKKDDSDEIKIHFANFIEVWHNKYPNMLTMPRDGAKIKSIILITINFIKAEGKPLTTKIVKPNGEQAIQDNVLVLWTWVIENLHKTWCHNKNLSTLESHYLEIIRELRYGKQINKYQQEPSGRRSARGQW